MAAVIGAVTVANGQNKIRRDEIRISLFEDRRNLIQRFDSISAKWMAEGRLEFADHQEFLNVVKDIELLFDARIHGHVWSIFKDAQLQTYLDRHWEKTFGRDSQRAGEAHEIFKKLAASFPEVRKVLVKATAIGNLGI